VAPGKTVGAWDGQQPGDFHASSWLPRFPWAGGVPDIPQA